MSIKKAIAIAFIMVFLTIAPFILSPYWTYLLGFALIMAIVGLGYNLLLGYMGLLSFGHAAYFGTGAYTVALLMNFTDIRSWEFLLLCSILASATIAAAVGYLSVRHTKVYFSLLTLAFGQVLYALIYKLYWLTRGSDGLNIFTPTLLGMEIKVPKEVFLTYYFYYYILAIFFISTIVMWIIVNSPFGKTIQSIRDNSIRAEFIGIPVWKYRWIAFTISGIYSGIGGALFAVLNGHITPDYVGWTFSGEIAFLTLLGGINSFYGPIVGAVLYTIIKIQAITTTIYWQFLLGAILVIMVLAFPGGIMGSLEIMSKKILSIQNKRVFTKNLSPPE